MTRFDSNTGDFAAYFDFDPKIAQPSALYLNFDEYYKKGFKVTVLSEENQGMKYLIVEDDYNHYDVQFEAPEQGSVIFTLTPKI